MNRQESEIGTCPSHWVITKLKEVAELKHGYQFRTGDFTESGVKIFKITQIQSNGSINLESCSFIDIDRLENFKNNLIKYGDILMALTGATIGKIARFNSTEIVLQNYRVGNFIPHDENILNKDYFYYFLTTDKIYYQIIANQNQSAQENVGKEDIHNMLIFLPPLPEQKAIASVLSSLDDKIDLLHQQNQTLEALAETLFRQWFIERRPEPVEGEAKEDWERKKIGDVLLTVLGGTPSTSKEEYWNGNIPWINSGEVNKFRILEGTKFITELGLKKSNTKLLPTGTTVLAITGATLGQVSLLEIDTCANQSVVGIIPNETLSKSFVFLWVKSKINEIILNETGGAQPHINKNDINETEIIIPDRESIDYVKNNIDPLFDKISKNCFQIQTLTKLRDTLLPKLMSGEVRVKM